MVVSAAPAVTGHWHDRLPVEPEKWAIVYNLFHHKGIAVAAYTTGHMATMPVLELAGIIIAHIALARVLGYGLKYPDSFQHTHHGTIGTN